MRNEREKSIIQLAELHTDEYLKQQLRESVSVALKPIQLNDTFSYQIYSYIGPKTRKVLTAHEDEYQKLLGYDPYLQSMTTRSWVLIDLLTIAIEWLIYEINTLLGYIGIANFGLSIVIFSIIIKYLFNPLNRKSIEAAKKMKKLQPQIQALQRKYENDKQKLQQELMILYKKHKINPFSGCLPLLIQLPFFWALYKVLPYLIDLKYSTFLWIKDLSEPDTIATIPIWPYEINLLPIIMTAISMIQSKFAPATTTTSDNKSTQYLLPALFLFIFWNFPSGLVLYWTIQTILQVIDYLLMNSSEKPSKTRKRRK